ncbi:MAG: SHOCT domain-containing protein [Nanoarchaeota archaeon]
MKKQTLIGILIIGLFLISSINLVYSGLGTPPPVQICSEENPCPKGYFCNEVSHTCINIARKPVCGDGICSNYESRITCPGDCECSINSHCKKNEICVDRKCLEEEIEEEIELSENIVGFTILSNPLVKYGSFGALGLILLAAIIFIVFKVAKRSKHKPSKEHIADEIEKLHSLMEKGIITREEFENRKKDIL